ncbi:thiosulfate/3-mercaptopyruvate sulfurtransferase [Pseudoduganella lurida]|uniref:Thiosulfate/3-mercaptopyruvate sulfurtransferase n=1 Tax=Pseudoduganella lurida TaxID=1036180 RepID=A0A562RMF4_9BURK|nr:rhodanese-like domain-containing protein [Pseudoduganella lurida]TWI70221.1 thiosulfate/3-mercaptopyruvate sulfurtransferase [Pseudoduganella lurida]
MSTPSRRHAGFRTDLPRWRQLVAPGWLAAVLAGEAVGAAPASGWLLIEAGCGERAGFVAGHIPGAAYLDTAEVEAPPLWNKVADDALLALLLARGIRHDSTVILYGRNQLAAARCAHLLLYAGVADVRLVDGGFGAWQAGGLPCEGGAGRAAMPATGFGAAFPSRPDYLIGIGAARALLAQPGGVLASIRSEAEFLGRISGYSYIAARGDIPGARWGRAGEDGDINSMSAYQEADGTMRPAADIAAFWGQAGIVPSRRIAFYCGTGWRASLAFFYAWLMGFENICVYDGGWLEWSADGGAGTACRVA